MSPKLVVLFGSGTMGQGLAHTIAKAGCEVIMIDSSEERLTAAQEKIGQALDAEIARWGLTSSEKKAILSRITISTDISQASKADLVIESIPEVMEEKRELFARLDVICPPDAILASNAASLPITEITAGLNRPERTIGLHFLNPVDKTSVVEVSRGLKTDDRTYQTILHFAGMLQKTPVTVFECPGFISTRIILPMINQAVKVLEEGTASCEDIDKTMKLGFGMNVGPMALADKVGVDALLFWMENLYQETFDQAFLPAKFLRKMVRSGLKGVKTGRGFFRYAEDGRRIEGSGLSPQELTNSTTRREGK